MSTYFTSPSLAAVMIGSLPMELGRWRWVPVGCIVLLVAMRWRSYFVGQTDLIDLVFYTVGFGCVGVLSVMFALFSRRNSRTAHTRIPK